MRDDLQPSVYLLGSHRHGTPYIGVTSNLLGRMWQQSDGSDGGLHVTL
jgi:putative endonuclease